MRLSLVSTRGRPRSTILSADLNLSGVPIDIISLYSFALKLLLAYFIVFLFYFWVDYNLSPHRMPYGPWAERGWGSLLVNVYHTCSLLSNYPINLSPSHRVHHNESFVLGSSSPLRTSTRMSQSDGRPVRLVTSRGGKSCCIIIKSNHCLIDAFISIGPLWLKVKLWILPRVCAKHKIYST